MSIDHAARVLALRVLERWCLVGEEPMEGEQWQTMCELAGVDSLSFAASATRLRLTMTHTERLARARQVQHERKLSYLGHDDAAADEAWVQPGRQRHSNGHGLAMSQDDVHSGDRSG